jgi:hypothetical protein
MIRNAARLSLLVAVTLIFLSVLPAAALAKTVSFVAWRDFEAGYRPVSVAVGDLNGDGVPDLAVANGRTIDNRPGHVSILLGNDDGTLQAPLTFAAGSTNPASVAIGDFNGDGVSDLAVTNAPESSVNPGSVSVLIGNGNGTFQAPRTFAAGFNPHSVVVGDFNGDRVLDLVVANARNPFTGDPGDVSVLLGNGDGTFQVPLTFAAANNPWSLAVGDFNGDGVRDLAVANARVYVNGDPGDPGSVSVLLGNGDGTFRAPLTLAANSNPYFIAVGDFNGDRVPDLAVANAQDPVSYGPGNVAVLLGNGDGTFQAPLTLAAADNPGSVAVGDFNGDGKLDLAAANVAAAGLSHPSQVSVLLGNGEGTFHAARNFAAASPRALAVSDFDCDGKLDLVVANAGFGGLPVPGHVSVLLGNGDGTFEAAPTVAAGKAPRSVAVGDFNSDGLPDLAVANEGDRNLGDPGNVSVLLTRGDGTFQAALTFTAGNHPQSVTVGDFNGDGKPDLAVANAGNLNLGDPGNVSVLLGNGDGTFGAPLTFATGTAPLSVAVGDFNGDEKPDLAVANFSSRTVSVLLGNGDGTFQAPLTFTTGTRRPRFVAVGDFNGDGKPDLAVIMQITLLTGEVSVLLGNGDGTFQAPLSFPSGRNPRSVAAGDFNGDGLPDLAVANSGDAFNGHPGNVSVLLGNGDGTFQAPLTFATANFPVSVAVGDFNGDGKPDLAVANSSFNVSVVLGNGNGTFRAARHFGAGAFPASLGVADFNGDGKPDLAVANAGSGSEPGNVSVLINNSPPAHHGQGP